MLMSELYAAVEKDKLATATWGEHTLYVVRPFGTV